MCGGYRTLDGRSAVYASVDGTDFRIFESSPFDPKWMSHKFRGPGLRYEIGVSVSTKRIVWLYGPFPAGQENDQGIFNLKMCQNLLENEKVLGDSGYGGPKVLHGSLEGDPDNSRAAMLRAYHERINGRIKSFGCMNQRWRHRLDKHHLCFFAVSHLVQLSIEYSTLV